MTTCRNSAATRRWRPASPKPAQAGYRGTELGGKFPRNSAELGPILSSYGLELVSGWYDGRILDRERR